MDDLREKLEALRLAVADKYKAGMARGQCPAGVFGLLPDGGVLALGIDTSCSLAKTLSATLAAMAMQETGCVAYVLAFETWFSRKGRPSEDPERQEALVVVVNDGAGDRMTLYPVTREAEGGPPSFGLPEENLEVQMLGALANMLGDGRTVH